MELTKTDLVILVAMPLAIIAMSFTMPAAGLTDQSDEVNESDVPEFSMNGSRFDFASEFPVGPAQAGRGTLVYNKSLSALEDDRRVWLEGSTSDGTELILTDTNEENASLRLNYWTSGSTQSDTVDINGTGNVAAIDNSTEGWKVKFTFEEIENKGESNVTITVDYVVLQRPSSGGWLGGVFSIGDKLANVVGWIGSTVFWFFGTLFEVSLNLVGMLYDIMLFGFDFVSWALTTYEGIISGASGFAQVFVVIPAIILTFEFAKVGMIGISLLPTT